MLRSCLSIVALGCFLGTCGASSARSAPSPTTLPASSKGWRAPGFVENAGQWPAPARFLARTAAGVVSLEEASFGLGAVRLELEGAAPECEPQGEGRLPGDCTYFQSRGRVLEAFATRRFSAVTYADVYPGISLRLVVSDDPGTPLKYDVLAEPGADLDCVAIRAVDAESLWLDADGALVIETPHGELRQPLPVTWEVAPDGSTVSVACTYRLLDGSRFGFSAPGRSPDARLVIDPLVEWGGFIGGPADEMFYDVKLREADNSLIVAGTTSSLSFPERDAADPIGGGNGSFDAFVFSVDAATGELRSAAILGGELDEEAWSIAIQSDGKVVIAGHTESPDFPAPVEDPPCAGANAFVARLSADLMGLESTVLLCGRGEDRAANVALGEAGSVWVLGYTDSPDFPTTANALRPTRPGGRYDLFLGQLLLDDRPLAEQILYSTYLGGSGAEPLDFGDTSTRLWELALATVDSGIVYLAGRTDSADFPTTPGAYDRTYQGDFSKAFLTGIDPKGSPAPRIVYSSYLGGFQDAAAARDIAVDADGGVWVTGFTWSSTFPTTPDAFERQFNRLDNEGADAFLVRLIPDDSLVQSAQFDYGTLLTGTSGAQRCSLGPSGIVAVVGVARASHLPVGPGAPGKGHSGCADGFLMLLDPALPREQQHLFSTYLGGIGEDFPAGLSTDSSGHVYVAGESTSFQIEGLPGTSNGSTDGLLVALDLRLPRAAFDTAGPQDGVVSFDASRSSTPPGTETPMAYRWHFGDGAEGTGQTTSHPYAPGRYTALLTVANNLELESSASATVVVPCLAGDVAPWLSADVGEPAVPGGAQLLETECLAVCASGKGIGTASDGFHFVYREADGDFELVAEVTEAVAAPASAQAGLMVRESLDAGSIHGSLLVVRREPLSVSFLERAEAGGTTRTQALDQPGRWLRLVRQGSLVSASRSADGVTWSEPVPVTSVAGGKVLVGLAASAKEGIAARTGPAFQAIFCSVSFRGGPEEATFRRGDADGRSGLDITDAIVTLAFLFAGGPAPTCVDAADANDSGLVDLSDAVYTLGHLFLGTPAPPEPFASCGVDPTPDALGCQEHAPCAE